MVMSCYDPGRRFRVYFTRSRGYLRRSVVTYTRWPPGGGGGTTPFPHCRSGTHYATRLFVYGRRSRYHAIEWIRDSILFEITVVFVANVPFTERRVKNGSIETERGLRAKRWTLKRLRLVEKRSPTDYI